MNATDTFKVKGFVRLQVINPDGSIASDTGFSENGITAAGVAAIAGLVGNTGSITAFSYLAVGTTATAFAKTQTTLAAEITDSGLARSQATVSRTTTTDTNDTLRHLYLWTASGSKTIVEAGIFNASSGGTMLGRKVTTSTSIVSGQLLQITYDIVFVASSS